MVRLYSTCYNSKKKELKMIKSKKDDKKDYFIPALVGIILLSFIGTASVIVYKFWFKI
jgi:hypothetical protein